MQQKSPVLAADITGALNNNDGLISDQTDGQQKSTVHCAADRFQPLALSEQQLLVPPIPEGFVPSIAFTASRAGASSCSAPYDFLRASQECSSDISDGTMLAALSQLLD